MVILYIGHFGARFKRTFQSYFFSEKFILFLRSLYEILLRCAILFILLNYF